MRYRQFVLLAAMGLLAACLGDITVDVDGVEGSGQALVCPRVSASASGSKSTTNLPELAIDGDPNTMWIAPGDTCAHWITVDLGSVQTINRVVLDWDRKFSSDYQLLVSTDGASFAVAAHVVNGDGGIDDVSFGPVDAQYVKMAAAADSCGGLKPHAFGIWELEIHGDACGSTGGGDTGGGGTTPACSGYPADDATCYTLVVDEQFSDASSLNIGAKDADPSTPWTVAYNGTWPDNGCISKKENVSVENGKLILRVLNAPGEPVPDAYSYYENKNIVAWYGRTTADCTFSEVRLRNEVGPYGFFEASIKAPGYGGGKERGSYIVGMFSYNFDDDVSPATSPAPAGYKAPWLEFDHELVANQPNATLNSLISTGPTSTQNQCDVWGCTWHMDNGYGAPVAFNHKTGFNTYGLEWTPTHLRYYVNKQLNWELSKDTVASQSDADANFPAEPLQMIFNFWMSNAGFGGSFKPTDFPSSLVGYDVEKYGAQIDWARWYAYTP